ncbi:dimethylsulfonioproprionate lyase family protein [Sinorhizobium meliloti]|uniref:dimethylsulfonioproprionate lyase family protein n=1 Tax=Rhizobium meliloti TaxID=382 RepID=UPI003F139E95
MATPSASLKLSEDLLLEVSGGLKEGPEPRGAGRPAELQEVILALGDLRLTNSVPSMAKFNLGLVLTLLEKPGPVLAGPHAETSGSLIEGARKALADAARLSEGHNRLSAGLKSLMGRLEWYRGRGGPYASANFAHSHMHALLVGPGALEHRTDLRIGLTVLGPYTRFPDHDQLYSRVFLPLSSGEFRFGDDDWVRSAAGEVLFNGAGRQCAFRCTGNAMVLLWCHIEGCIR